MPDAGTAVATCDYPIAYYIDPAHGDDRNDGKSESAAKRSLSALPAAAEANTGIAIKRGTVLRLAEAFRLHGSEQGSVCYGAYGDASLPKPIVAGSVAIAASAWSGPDTNGLYTFDWTPHLIVGGAATPTGIEQAPGNLWFFDADTDGAAMTGWGWRKAAVANVTADRDWFYEPQSHLIKLKWSGAPPPATEAARSFEPAIDFSGQQNIIVEDWDLRFMGGYAMTGHSMSHVRVRRVDAAFIGGGTKVGAYVRLGNVLETTGNASDIVVEDSRFHQIFDTGFDPQNTGGASVQTDIVFRNNVVSRTGLAGVELWLQPAGTRLERVTVSGNTFVNIGHGWGYEQHDFPGGAKIGAAVFVSSNEATTSDIRITDNLFASSRAMLVSSFRPSEPETIALVKGLLMEKNRWSSIGPPAVILFTGTIGPDGVPVLGDSPVFANLHDWQTNAIVPGKDTQTVEVGAPALPREVAATRFGPFPLAP